MIIAGILITLVSAGWLAILTSKGLPPDIHFWATLMLGQIWLTSK